MDVGQISRRLAEQAQQIAAYLLPNGKLLGREWTAGSVEGEAGQSLKVCVAGTKAGVWSDFATGEGGDLLDLWCAVRRQALAETIPEAKAYLGIHDPFPAPQRRRDYRRPSKPKATRPTSKVQAYLEGRGLADKTITAYQVAELDKRGNEPGPWIVFPFKRGDELVFIKYLHLDREGGKKKIRAEADCEPTLFGQNVIPDDKRYLAITEGELDAMSLFEYGFPAVSVPFGGGTGAKHAWIESDWEWLERFSEIFLCMDSDAEGQAAAKDIAQRLGLHRCKVVRLPKKDANECLVAGISKDDLSQCFLDAESFDPEELKPANAYADGVIERFYPQGGQRAGFNLPWQKTHGRIRLYQGEVSIWTGTNGHGKSLLLGQTMMGAARQGHRCCVVSFEMQPEKTLSRMVQQWSKVPNPPKETIRLALDWMDGSVWIFDLVGTAKRKRLLEVFNFAFHRHGIRQFVIDSLDKCGIGEDDYNGQKDFIDTLGDFAKSTGSHIHLVAHARKGHDEYSPPGKMDVKGTGALTDMVDNVFCVYRNKAKERDLNTIENGGAIKGKTRQEIEREYDAFLICDKHRENGADAEGMFGLFFDRQSLSFLEEQPSEGESEHGRSSQGI